jgi:hypothetical protein
MEKNVKYTVRLRIEYTYVGIAGVSVSTIHTCPHSYYADDTCSSSYEDTCRSSYDDTC